MWSKFHVSTQYILFHGRYLDFWNNIVSSWRAFFSWTPEPKINHFGMILILVLGPLKMIIWIMWVSSTVTKQKRSRTPWPCFTVFLGSLDATLRTTGVDHDICLFLKNLFVFTSLCPTFFSSHQWVQPCCTSWDLCISSTCRNFPNTVLKLSECASVPEQLIELSSAAVDPPVLLFSCHTLKQLLEARGCVGGCCDPSSALLFLDSRLSKFGAPVSVPNPTAGSLAKNGCSGIAVLESGMCANRFSFGLNSDGLNRQSQGVSVDRESLCFCVRVCVDEK